MVASASGNGLSASVDPQIGSYSLAVDGEEWLQGGGDPPLNYKFKEVTKGPGPTDGSVNVTIVWSAAQQDTPVSTRVSVVSSSRAHFVVAPSLLHAMA